MTTAFLDFVGLNPSHVNALAGFLGPLLGLWTWTTLFVVRNSHHDPSIWQDLILSLLFNGFAIYKRSPYVTKYHIIGCTTALLAMYALWLFNIWPQKFENMGSGTRTECSQQPWARPLIFPCRTTHTRLFPKKHSFSYSYLFVGIPVGWRGRMRSMLSADIVQRKRGWFHVDAADYLERDVPGQVGLRGKLDHYLVGQGINPKEFPYVYLATAPRVLGYSFNPVSFWYLYSADRELNAMILEVNNTFDERRLYYLPAASTSKEHQLASSNGADPPSKAQEPKTPRFTSAWPKDFHVSPFNSREGSYALSATDPRPLTPNSLDKAVSSHLTTVSLPTAINNTITLLSPTPKLTARIFSTEPALDPISISYVKSIYLLLRYGWIGFITFPRILREAANLFFAKKIQVWFRPEVLESSIPRQATQDERMLETVFRRFLADKIANAKIPVTLTYKPAPGTGSSTDRSMVFSSLSFPSSPNGQDTTPTSLPITTTSTSTTNNTTKDITLTIITPTFYTRLPHYPSFAVTVHSEFFATDTKNHTLSLSGASSSPSSAAHLLSHLLDHPTTALNHRKHSISRMENLRWKVLAHLRCPPPAPSYPVPNSDSTSSTPSPPSGPDHLQEQPHHDQTNPFTTFARSTLPAQDSKTYRRILTSQFLASRFAFGFVGVVALLDLGIRGVLVWWGGIGGALDGGANGLDVWQILRTVAISNTIHLWAWAKGW